MRPLLLIRQRDSPSTRLATLQSKKATVDLKIKDDFYRRKILLFAKSVKLVDFIPELEGKIVACWTPTPSQPNFFQVRQWHKAE